jgi:hypothetical protein
MEFYLSEETAALIIGSRKTYPSRQKVAIDGHSSIGRHPRKGARNWWVAAKRPAEKAIQVRKLVEIMEISSRIWLHSCLPKLVSEAQLTVAVLRQR